MENARLLRKHFYKSCPSVKFMDEFESKDESGKEKYDTFLLTDVFKIIYSDRLIYVGLYIERYSKGVEFIESSLTFTELKRELAGPLYNASHRYQFKVLDPVFEGLDKLLIAQNGTDSFDYRFAVPVQFNAQNSSNRCGYGNRYCGDQLVYEGTLYGEPTKYMFVGARYSF